MPVTPFPRRSQLSATVPRHGQGRAAVAALVLSACATGVITDPGKEPGRSGSGVNVAGSGGAASDAGLTESGGAGDPEAGGGGEPGQGGGGSSVDGGDSGGAGNTTDGGDAGPV